VLLEIFDESAYRRFLDRTLRQPSPESYAEFLQERASATDRRPRCC